MTEAAEEVLGFLGRCYAVAEVRLAPLVEELRWSQWTNRSRTAPGDIVGVLMVGGADPRRTD